jgi:hypothetical protein
MIPSPGQSAERTLKDLHPIVAGIIDDLDRWASVGPANGTTRRVGKALR